MAIKEALLALLQRSPASAYQLKKEFDATTSETWPLNIGQVSTTLQRLHRDGLIEQCPDEASDAIKEAAATTTAVDPHATGHVTAPSRTATTSRVRTQPTAVWRLTDTGREAVSQWWSTPVTIEQRGRDELVMKLAFAVSTPGVNVTALIQRQRSALQRLLHDVTLARRALPQNDIAGLLVLDHHIFATEAELRWLDTIDEHRLRARI
ncbi:PadR family transcriptional regulator [Bifidobacterium simiarum]|uniref:PadR family transcriptional regulator n=1 Tax=Bifidobacterium simiarum TaxID=2045441 RepID=A0A2M9HE17_9BIFI|nr:PadR family transcriptional regulator [Bifidobacterium simiarum]PJM75045.1 PadR family transcriptional regulator [Bifidobacterium simiarum]